MFTRLLLAGSLVMLIGVPSTAEDPARTETPLLSQLAEMGSAAIPHLFTGSSDVQRQLVSDAGEANWPEAVAHLTASFDRGNDGFLRDITDYEYLIALRIAGLYMDSEIDADGQARLVRGVYETELKEELAPFYPVLLCSENKHLQMHGLFLASHYPTFPPGIVERLRELTESSDPSVRYWATILLPQFERGRITMPVRETGIGLGGNIGGGGGPGGGGGFEYRRPRDGERPDYELLLNPADFRVGDLPRLQQLYRGGDEQMRYSVAVVLRTHRWPEAYHLVKEMLADRLLDIREIAVDLMIEYGTPEARATLCGHFLVEQNSALRFATLRFVLSDETPQPGRDHVFAAALQRRRDAEVCLALQALERGRMAATEAMRAALVERFLAAPGPRDYVARGLACLWDSDFPTTLRGMVSAVHITDADYVEFVTHEIGIAGRGRPSEQAARLLHPFLASTDETVRSTAVRTMVGFLSGPAIDDLTTVLERGDITLATTALEALESVKEDPRVVDLLDTAISLERPELLEGTLRTIRSWVDARSEARLVRFATGSARPDYRESALSILTEIGTQRTTAGLAPILADDPNIVAIAVFDLDRLLRIDAPEIASLVCERFLGEYRRVRNREALWEALLGRLAGGDYDVYTWFRERLPNLDLPEDPDDMMPVPLAQWIADRLGVAVGPIVNPGTVGNLLPLTWEDADGVRWEYQVPWRLHQAIGVTRYFRSSTSQITLASRQPPMAYRVGRRD